MANSACRKLLFLVQKRFLKTSATVSSPSLASSSSSSSLAVQFLTSSLGLPLESAIPAARKLKPYKIKLQMLNRVLDFFKSHGFNNTQIAKLVVKCPTILQSRVESVLSPKFQFLIKEGFVGPVLQEIIVSNPVILKRGLDSCLRPSIGLLKEFLDSNEKILVAVKRASWLLTCDVMCVMRPNIDLLMKEGVPVSVISKLILRRSRTMMKMHDKMVYVVKTVKSLGLEPKSPMFVHAVASMMSMNESVWKKKVETFKSVGWTEDRILWAFRRDPMVFTVSEEKIRSSMDFYVNTMKVEPDFIASNPRILTNSLDKRVRPRYNVLKVLEDKKLYKLHKGSTWVLTTIGEKLFLENYVTKHLDKIPDLMEIYHAAKPKK